MKSTLVRSLFESRRSFLISLSLALAAFVVYGRTWRYEFTNYDDFFIISNNPAVASGLTLRGLWWGFTTNYFEFWHPVTWWSHMLDCELFGMHAGLHHLMNLAFHVANTWVLFALLQRLTGATWRSAVVAALFALHPMHVESVAWLAERKDLLSAFFWLLSVWNYTGYVRESGLQSPLARAAYRRSLLFFALALMSKPMAVTLPFVLLLLDFWPLGRLEPSAIHRQISAIWRLIREKLPFFGLSFLSCLITLAGVIKEDRVLSTEKLSWTLRLANVPVSYARYLWKLIWPTDMTVLYLMPSRWELWQVAGACLVLAVISVIVLSLVRPAPYLVFGWLVFLGVLVPTIGLVPVGFQSIADRYTYLPYVGLFVALVWGISDLSRRWRFRGLILGIVTSTSLLACGGLAYNQVQYWQNSLALWSRCLAVNKENAIAHYNLGYVLHHSGDLTGAAKHYEQALQIKPDHLDANLNLGALLADGGKFEEATNYYARALRAKPDYDKAHLNMAIALQELGDYSGATNYCAQALAVNPKMPQAHCVYAFALLELGDFNGAITYAAEALRLDSKDFRALTWEARALAAQGRSAEAIRDYSGALDINPNYFEARYRLGLEWAKLANFEEAAQNFQAAVQLAPNSADAHFELASSLVRLRRTEEAIASYRKALRLKPDSAAALNNLAWILATHPQKEFRNGDEAIKFARQACELTTNAQPVFLGTLAAAYAEIGQFDNAIATAQKAGDLALSRGETNAFDRNQKLLKHFENRNPYREEE